MGQLDVAAPIVDAAQIPDDIPPDVADEIGERNVRVAQRNLSTLREFTEIDPSGKDKRVHFRFFSNPVEILGGDRVEGLRVEKTEVVDGRAVGTGAFSDIPCGLVIPAIGYYSEPIDGVPFEDGRARNQDGRIDVGLYAVGWIKRGPSGVIGSNKPDGDTAAAQILEDLPEGGKPGQAALTRHLAGNGARPISFEEWKRIEAAEEANATDGAPRRKYSRVADMLAVLDG
jgi:ferredoxin--NADP+ reductase